MPAMMNADEVERIAAAAAGLKASVLHFVEMAPQHYPKEQLDKETLVALFAVTAGRVMSAAILSYCRDRSLEGVSAPAMATACARLIGEVIEQAPTDEAAIGMGQLVNAQMAAGAREYREAMAPQGRA